MGVCCGGSVLPVVNAADPTVGSFVFLAEHSFAQALPAPVQFRVIRVIGISTARRNVRSRGRIEALLHFRPVSTQLNRTYLITSRPPGLSLICPVIVWLKLAQSGRLCVANLVLRFLLPLCAGLQSCR